jgi:nicotinic acetylcholine receptor
MYSTVQNTLFRVTVFHDGTVYWHPGGKYTIRCDIDATEFPMDEQKCQIKICNWEYSVNDVNLTFTDASAVLENVDNGQWITTDITVERRERSYLNDWHKECCVIFHIHFNRRPLYYVVNLLLPAAMLSVLSLLVFWVPTDSGEKLSLGVTILLSYTLFLLMVSDHIPVTSLTTPNIVIVMLLDMALNCLTLALSVLVVRLHHIGGSRPLPSRLQTCLYIMNCEHNEVDSDPGHHTLRLWKDVSICCDKLSFWLAVAVKGILLIVYVVLSEYPSNKASTKWCLA